MPGAELSRQRKVVDAFLAASRNGDFATLLSLLDPDVVFRADEMAVRMGALAEIRGAEAVANTFKGRAQGARPALVDGGMALLVVFGGKLRVAVKLTFAGGKIAGFEAVAEPDRLQGLEIGVLE
jgi:RNA polymerase sigma-70 factor (ECF subfamily)